MTAPAEQDAGRQGEDRVVIVTGAAGGIGRRLVAAFVERGYRVAASDVAAEGVAALESRYGRAQVLGAVCDVADADACKAHVGQVLDRFGALHVVVNNAGIGMNVVRSDYFERPVTTEEVSPETWSRVIATNLSGPFFLTRCAAPVLKAQRWGRIINVTTSFFTMLNRGFAPYGPAKAGLEAWSASLAVELDGSGVTVNVVVPGGPADTPMVPAEARFERAALVSPALMAAPMLWLCSDAAAGVTGRRFVAADWAPNAPHRPDRMGTRVAWPDLAVSRVWPA